MKIQIMAVDNSIPQIVTNKGAQTLRILATGHVGFLITNKVLKVEDRDSLHIALKIRITEGPRHGFLIHLGKGNHSISQFTQGITVLSVFFSSLESFFFHVKLCNN